MTPVAPGVRVWLAVGKTDMRRGMNRRLTRRSSAIRLHATFSSSVEREEI